MQPQNFPTKVYINKLEPASQSIAAALSCAFDWLGLSFKSNEHIVLKPNLTYPVYEPGVCTSPVFMEGIMILFAEHGIKSTWVEGDGGNATYTADEAFTGHGFDRFISRYGVRVMNVSNHERVMQTMEVAGKNFQLPVPRFFIERPFDRFITLPVFKTHVYTQISLGFKNLWGLIPDPLRIYYHYLLDRGIIGLVKTLKPDIAVMDGLVSLDGEGPINGFSVETNRFLVSNHVGAAEVVGARMMGVDPGKPKYLQFAAMEGLLPRPGSIHTSRAVQDFSVHQFRMKRNIWNHASIQMSRFPWLQKFVYHSSFSPLIYQLLGILRGHNKKQQLMRTGFWRER